MFVMVTFFIVTNMAITQKVKVRFIIMGSSSQILVMRSWD